MIYIAKEVCAAIRDAFSAHTPECGGVLGAVPGGPVTHFYYDASGICLPQSYTPDCDAVNHMLEWEWAPMGVQMVGIIHSHSNAGSFPSCGDLYYCEQIMKTAHLQEFLLSIVTLEPFQVHAYVAELRSEQITVRQEIFCEV